MEKFGREFIGNNVILESESSYSIENIKEKIQKNEEIPPNQQKLIFTGNQVQD
jgi:hypothetical protein